MDDGEANIRFPPGDRYLIEGRGWAFTVQLDRKCYDFDWIIGKVVIVGDFRGEVVSVERFAHAPPWGPHEPISLLMKDVCRLQREENDDYE